MPLVTTTIEDTSPVIVYSGNDWRAGTSSDDPLTERYSQSSYMVTNGTQADVSFTFYGTGVQVWGAKRSNHGFYQISIDSLIYPQVNGATNDTQFQVSLFSSIALRDSFHTIRMANVGRAFLDLDMISWQTPVGSSDEKLISSTVQDDDSAFQYNSDSQWTTSPVSLGMFLGGSGHATTTPGASVQLKFRGCLLNNLIATRKGLIILLAGGAVALYGPVGPTCAPYSVTLDGGNPSNYSATKQFYRPQQLLYHTGGLAKDEHTLVIRSESWNNSALYLAIDYAQVFSTSSLEEGGGLSVGAIVGVSLGGSFGMLFLAAILFFCIRSERSKKLSSKRQSESQTLTTEPFMISQNSPATPGNWPLLSGDGATYSDVTSPGMTTTTTPEGGYSNLLPLRPSKRMLYDDLARNSQAPVRPPSSPAAEEPRPHIMDEKKLLVSSNPSESQVTSNQIASEKDVLPGYRS